VKTVYTEKEINELEKKLLLQELEINKLKQQIKVHEFEDYKLNEIQSLAKAANWELNHLSYELKFSEGMSFLFNEHGPSTSKISWNDFLDLMIDSDSTKNIRNLLITNVIKNKEELVIEHPIKNLKNEQFFVRHHCKTFYNTLGHPLTTIGLIIDITEQNKNQEVMYHQSKIASIGEMIGNIAHQWRQPLSAISTCASGAKMKKEYGLLEDEEFFKNMDTINNTTQYLSKTIDDFRSFFVADTTLESEVNLVDIIEKTLALIIDSYKNSNVEIIKEYQDSNYLVKCNENLLLQALINIFNNAKDALMSENFTGNKIVSIVLNNINNKICLEIKDNAGGIPAEIIDKIFEPYFTTKHSSQGTGIGLYMTNQIITKHLKSKIIVENVQWQYQNKDYKGASFKILIDK